MAERRNAQHGLVDAWTAELGGPRTAALHARGVACAIAFAWLRNAGYRRVRYRGRRRNEVDFALHLVAYNWKRSLSLMSG